MKKNPLCFISYAQVDAHFVYDEILPILNELQINTWIAAENINPGDSFVETTIIGIKQSDVVICFMNKKSTYVNFEIGAAFGNNKPIIVIAHDPWEVYPFYNQVTYLRYGNKENVQKKLRNIINNVLYNVIDKSNFTENKAKKILGIQVGFEESDFEMELRFTTELIELIKELTDQDTIELIQTGKGSLKSLVSLDLKSWAELLEKVIFFIPELKKKKADRLKVDAETEKTKAETEKTREETRQLHVETNIRQAEAFVNLLEKYQKLGIKIQVDNDLLITQNPNGQLEFKKPKKEDEE